MAIYEYKCLKCGSMLVKLVRKSEDEPRKCDCGGDYKKIISKPAKNLQKLT